MTKVKLLVVCFSLFGYSQVCAGQKLLKKNEIYSYWISSNPSSINCDKAINQLSNNIDVDAQIKTRILSLRSRDIDTLLILVNSHPGTFIADTCSASNYPTDIYIFWRVAGKDSLIKIFNSCKLDKIESSCSQVFDFYSQHQDQLEQENIIPVILGAKMQNNKIVYSRVISSDIDEYIFFYSIHGHCKKFVFSKADITNKDSLFYLDNIESMVFRWFEALQFIVTSNR